MDKLTKTHNGKILTGVCAGLEKKYGLNAWIFRALFLLSGIGIPVYIVMAIILPEEP